MKPEVELRNGSNLCIVMAYDDNMKNCGDLTSGVNLDYCRKAKYDFRVYTSGFDKTRSKGWSKLSFVRECLGDYEWVMWMDADAVFTNHAQKMNEFMALGGVLTICKDAPKWGLNDGVFFIRRCDRALTLLDAIGNTRHPDKDVEPVLQVVIDSYARSMGKDVVVYPTKSFNSFVTNDPGYPQENRWRRGDFVAHCVGRAHPDDKADNLRVTLWRAKLLER